MAESNSAFSNSPPLSLQEKKPALALFSLPYNKHIAFCISSLGLPESRTQDLKSISKQNLLLLRCGGVGVGGRGRDVRGERLLVPHLL